MKRLTREEKRQRRVSHILWLVVICCGMIVLCLLLSEDRAEAEAAEPVREAETVKHLEAEHLTAEPEDDGSLPGDDTPALVRCYLTDEEREAAENELIEAALLARAHVIEDCTVSHYDCCVECCGKTDGITASGRRATPGVTVAVDPQVIPLDSDVLVDYHDGTGLHYYRADDTGGAVKGNHIDLCVSSHEEALELGIRTATVYWVPQM